MQAEINTMNECRGLAVGRRSEMVGVEGLHHGQTDVNRGLHVPQSFYHEQDLVNAHTHTEMMTPTPPSPADCQYCQLRQNLARIGHQIAEKMPHVHAILSAIHSTVNAMNCSVIKTVNSFGFAPTSLAWVSKREKNCAKRRFRGCLGISN